MYSWRREAGRLCGSIRGSEDVCVLTQRLLDEDRIARTRWFPLCAAAWKCCEFGDMKVPGVWSRVDDFSCAEWPSRGHGNRDDEMPKGWASSYREIDVGCASAAGATA